MGMHCLYQLIPVLTFECTMTLRILKLTVFSVESVFEKLSALTGTSFTCSQCSLIAEWGGAVKGRPVRLEIPLCSAVLKQRVWEVDPTYVVPHKERLNLYTTEEREHKRSLSY